MRVLYVEDNPANVFLVKRVARMGNHEIINLIDGQQALRKFDDIQPDLVLMDIQLSGELGGLEVVRKLRERGVTTPIIAVTAYAMVGDKERCLEAGCDEYMAKPLQITRLVELFQNTASIAKATSEAANEATDATASETDTSDAPPNTDTTAADAPVAASDTTDSTADDTAQTPPPAVTTDSVASAPDGSVTPAATDNEPPVSEDSTADASASHETDSGTDTDNKPDTTIVTESTGQPDVQSGN